MRILRSVVTWILLASVTAALGDAPYVDELLDALCVRDGQAQAVSPSGHQDHAPASPDDPSCCLRIYQALSSITAAPDAVPLAAAAPSRRYFPAAHPPLASTDSRRIDRPPARTAA